MIDIPVVATLLSLSPHFNISIQSLASVDTSILLAFIPCSMVNTFFPYCLCLVLQTITQCSTYLFLCHLSDSFF